MPSLSFSLSSSLMYSHILSWAHVPDPTPSRPLRPAIKGIKKKKKKKNNTNFMGTKRERYSHEPMRENEGDMREHEPHENEARKKQSFSGNDNYLLDISAFLCYNCAIKW